MMSRGSRSCTDSLFHPAPYKFRALLRRQQQSVNCASYCRAPITSDHKGVARHAFNLLTLRPALRSIGRVPPAWLDPFVPVFARDAEELGAVSVHFLAEADRASPARDDRL